MLRMLFISTQITFFGELSVDTGGPRREFFRLLVHQAADTLLRGKNVKFFSMNVSAIVVCSIVLSITKCSNIHISFNISVYRLYQIVAFDVVDCSV